MTTPPQVDAKADDEDPRCATPRRSFLSGKDILATEFVGMWKDRADITAEGTEAYARHLREKLYKHGGATDH